MNLFSRLANEVLNSLLHKITQVHKKGPLTATTLSMPIHSSSHFHSVLLSFSEFANALTANWNKFKRGKTKFLLDLRGGPQNSLLQSSRNHTQSQVKRGYKLLPGYNSTDINDWQPTNSFQRPTTLHTHARQAVN